MSLRILILGLAVGVCALWPQGLVLCLGEADHVEIEPTGKNCCPVGHQEEESAPDDDHSHDDCGRCRDFESPELTTALAAPAVFAPATALDATPAPALPATPAGDTPPARAPDDLRTVILVV